MFHNLFIKPLIKSWLDTVLSDRMRQLSTAVGVIAQRSGATTLAVHWMYMFSSDINSLLPNWRVPLIIATKAEVKYGINAVGILLLSIFEFPYFLKNNYHL
jgi:hypothetical protein